VARAEAQGRPVMMAVAVAGTTGAGALDPVDGLCDLLDRWEAERGWRIWRHVDAAWGGFQCSLLGGPDEADVLSPEGAGALRAIGRAHSVTIDPHKQGYTPYACGAFLARDRDCYAVSSFAAPYLDRPGAETAKWTSTLEGSRSAGGASAVWLTGRSLGYGPGGLGAVVAETIRTRRAFEQALAREAPELRLLEPADGAIACFCAAAPGEPLSRVNRRTEALFEALLASPELSVSRTSLGEAGAAQIARHVAGWGGVRDAAELVLIRCVLMNPYWASPGIRYRLIPTLAGAIGAALRGLGEAGREKTATL
jgi:glutamate/tyrosine decarboxylase-like PLP-dependent enzyme